MKVRNLVGMIILILLIAAFTLLVFVGIPVGIYDFKPIDAVQLGLDLTGGVSIRYEAVDPNQDDLDTKIEGAINIFRTRLDSKGFTEATISKEGTAGIRVEIPVNQTSTITDPSEIVEFIGTPAKLEFLDPNKQVIMEGQDITSAKPYMDDKGAYYVYFELTSEGQKLFADATTEFIGQNISITLDGNTISDATVEEAITGGKGSISGNFTQEEAVNLAMQIESGALPLELNILEQRSINSTLGDDALSKSILAGLIGFAILIIFMVVIYRTPGFMADIALVAYVSLVLFFIALLKVQLTLPGIAGIILGIGMAVDANVVIFERFKEEAYLGKSIRSSMKSGYSKAATAIIDSNVTTIIAAIVLAIFGTGSIKGFAFTLAISIVVSMFTALVIARWLLNNCIAMFPNGKEMYLPTKKNKGGAEQ